MKENLPYLLLAMCLASGRNIASKKMATDSSRTEQFFFSQALLFLSAGLLIAISGFGQLISVSAFTLFAGLIYGALLVLSQWMLTLSLKNGNTSICTIIYSLGFIIPTISGAILWNESFTLLNGIGLALALVVILLTANQKDATQDKRAIPPYIFIAMLASGGLGLMQKVQQSSQFSGEKIAFFLIAFAFAFMSSIIGLLICQKPLTPQHLKVTFPCITGLCFGGSNMCNTMLAGRMPSAVFFPFQNISTIILSTLLGILLFKEKMTGRNLIVLSLGILVVVFFSINFG